MDSRSFRDWWNLSGRPRWWNLLRLPPSRNEQEVTHDDVCTTIGRRAADDDAGGVATVMRSPCRSCGVSACDGFIQGCRCPPAAPKASKRQRDTAPAASTCTGFAVSFASDAVGEATLRKAVAAFLRTALGSGYARPASKWTATRVGRGFEFRSGTDWVSVVPLPEHAALPEPAALPEHAVLPEHAWAVDEGRHCRPVRAAAAFARHAPTPSFSRPPARWLIVRGDHEVDLRSPRQWLM